MGAMRFGWDCVWGWWGSEARYREGKKRMYVIYKSITTAAGRFYQ
jgi:hypothetical protein